MGGKQAQVKKHPEFTRSALRIEGVLQKLNIPLNIGIIGKIMKKQEGGTWKERYFKLNDKELGYYESRS